MRKKTKAQQAFEAELGAAGSSPSGTIFGGGQGGETLEDALASMGGKPAETPFDIPGVPSIVERTGLKAVQTNMRAARNIGAFTGRPEGPEFYAPAEEAVGKALESTDASQDPLTNAFIGAGLGAAAGSALGPIGTGLGAVAGGAAAYAMPNFLADLIGEGVLSAPGLVGGTFAKATGAALALPGAEGISQALISKLGGGAVGRAATTAGKQALEGAAYEVGFRGAEGEPLTGEGLGLAAGLNVALPAALHGLGKGLGKGTEVIGNALERRALSKPVQIPLVRDRSKANSASIEDLNPVVGGHAKALQGEGFKVTSTLRGEEHSVSQGRKYVSAHEFGLGFDAVPETGTFNENLFKAKAFAKAFNYDVIHEGVGTANEHFHFEPKGKYSVGKNGEHLLDGKPYFETTQALPKKGPQELPIEETARRYPNTLNAEDLTDLAASRNRIKQAQRTLAPEVDPQYHQQMAKVDEDIARFTQTDPDVAASLTVQRNKEVDRLNQEAADRLSATATPQAPEQAPQRLVDVQGVPREPGTIPSSDVLGGKLEAPISATEVANAGPERNPLFEVPSLPKELKDRQMNVGGRPVKFANDVDQALYMAAKISAVPPEQAGFEQLQARAQQYMSYLQEAFPGETPEEILAHGAEVAQKVDGLVQITPVGKPISVDTGLNRGALIRRQGMKADPLLTGMETLAKQVKATGNDQAVQMLHGEGIPDNEIAQSLGLPEEVVTAYRTQNKLPDVASPEFKTWKAGVEQAAELARRDGLKEFTILGEKVTYEDFIQTKAFEDLTSEEFLANVFEKARLTEGDYTALMKARKATVESARRAAKTMGPVELDNYISLLESRLPNTISIRLSPSENKIARQLMEIIEFESKQLEKKYGITTPYKTPDVFFRILGKYLATEFRADRVTDEQLAEYIRGLDLYMERAKSGKLTPEEHAYQLDRLAEVLDNVNIIHGLVQRSGKGGSYGTYGSTTGKVYVSEQATLDTLAHEVLHAMTLGDEVFNNVLERIISDVSAAEQTGLAYWLGHYDPQNAYAQDVGENAVRAFQAYWRNPQGLKELAPTIYSIADEAIAGLPENYKNMFGLVQYVQKAGDVVRQHPSYKNYGFLKKPVGTNLESPNHLLNAKAIRDNTLLLSRASSNQYKGAQKFAFNYLLSDGQYKVPMRGVAWLELTNIFDAAVKTRTMARVPGLKWADSFPIQHFDQSEPNLWFDAADVIYSAKRDMRDKVWNMAKTSVNGTASFFHNYAFRKFAGINSRATARVGFVDEGGVFQSRAAEPHMNLTKAAADEMHDKILADKYRDISGPEGLIHDQGTQEALPKFWKDTVQFWKGKFDSINPEYNKSVKELLIAGEKEFKYYTEAELEAKGVDAKVAKTYLNVARVVQTNSVALKLAKTEDVIRGDSDLSKYRGQGYTTEELLGMDEGSVETKKMLAAISAQYKPGYYPHVRLGGYRVHAMNPETKKSMETIGAFSVKEAEEKVAALQEKYPEANVVWKAEPPAFSYASNLDLKASDLKDLLHLMQASEGAPELNEDEVMGLLDQLRGKSGIQKYFAERKNVSGWEDQSYLDEVLKFQQMVSNFTHGIEFKNKVQDLRDNGEWTLEQKQEIGAVYNNTLNVASKWEEGLDNLFHHIAPNMPNLRVFGAQMRNITTGLKLGYSSFKKVTLDANHFWTVTFPELATHAGSLVQKSGLSSAKLATKFTAEAIKESLDIIMGTDRDSDAFKALVVAQELGYVKPLRFSEGKGKQAIWGQTKDFFATNEGGATRRHAFFNALQSKLDFIGQRSDDWRQMVTFLSFYKTVKTSMPQLDDAAAIAFAGEHARTTLDLKSSNRPALPEISGELGNQFFTFKNFMWNALDKVIQNSRLFKGAVIEIPNEDWTPGSDLPKTKSLYHKDTAPLILMLGATSLFGGVSGIPFIGLGISWYNGVTGDDVLLRLRGAIKKSMPNAWGSFAANSLDGGLVGNGLGIDMNEFGNLMYPGNTKDILEFFTLPAFSIGAQMVSGTYKALTETSPHLSQPLFTALKTVEAVSPSTVKHIAEAVELNLNKGKIYDQGGQLISKVDSPLVSIRTALAGMHGIKDEAWRRHVVDTNMTKAYRERLSERALTIARKISTNEVLDFTDIRHLQSTPTMARLVQNKLLGLEVPSEEKVLKQIAKSKDPELARLRWLIYQSFWVDAHTKGEQKEEF